MCEQLAPRLAGDADAWRHDPFDLLAALLDQLAGVLEATSDSQYTQRPVGVVSSSLGGHVRHCLDHFNALCRGAEKGAIDYDDRERGTMVETSRRAALSTIAELQERLERLDTSMLPMPLRIRSVISSDGQSLENVTSLGRELVFVLSHTVHHNALLAVMCRTLGIPLPDDFGYAPSTLAHAAEAACAR
ncbi:MAG: DinB family protein [Phycisphaerales bacterium]|nr:DinB family protein [Phycisphaerales bacterium]